MTLDEMLESIMITPPETYRSPVKAEVMRWRNRGKSRHSLLLCFTHKKTSVVVVEGQIIFDDAIP